MLRQVDPYSFPKRLVHTGWFVTSFFHFQNNPFSLSSAGICLRLLLRPHPPSVFPSVKCIIRHYLRNMSLMYLAFFFVGYFFLVYPVLHFFSHANGPNGLFLPSPAPQFETLHVFLIYFRSDQVTAQRNTMYRLQHLTSLFLKIISVCWWKEPPSFWMQLMLWQSWN